MDSSPAPAKKKEGGREGEGEEEKVGRRKMGRREMTVKISCYVLHVTNLINIYNF